MSIITDKIASNVLDGVINVHGIRRNLDSSTDERRCFVLTPEDIELYTSLFKYNSGETSDGKVINLIEPTVYVKVPVNIHMVEPNVPVTHESYVYTIEGRAKTGNASLQLFVDGYKIPDNEVKFYPTRSNVDVFIPNKYLPTTSEHEIIVEKKRYDEFPYIHFYENQVNNQQFTIPMTPEIRNKISEVSGNLERNFQIYVNKKLLNSSRTVMFSNNNIIISVTSEMSNSEVEIIFDPYVVWYFPANQMNYGDIKNIWEIPESYLDSIHGPLSNFSCSFYINGLRVMNDVVDQKGRLHFEHDTEGKVDNAISFYLSDRNYITDENLTLYGKDYYLYNFVGTSALTRALHTTVSGSPFIDEGANKTISFSVNKKIGDSKIVITLPAGIRYTNDGVQKISLKVYKTRSIDESRYQVDDFLTEIVPADYTVDNSTNPMTITIHAPSSYFANGINTSGVIEFESWYDWDYVMNDYNTLFPRSKVEEILEEFYNSYDHSERVSELLTDRPYLMRTFLENFGYQNYEQEIEYNGLDAYVYVGLPDTVDLTVEKKYDITINNKHVPNNKVEIVNKDVTEIFKIEGRYFVKGSNNVSIQIIDEIPVEYQTFSPEDILEDDGLRILTVSGFENLGNFENNIIVLEKIDSTDPEATQFATSAKVGYKVFENYTFGPYDEDTGTISLIFDRIPDHEFLVYNKNFSTSYAYVKPSISTVTDVIIPVYLGTENNPIPFIPRGKIYVYCGNDKFIEGIDYFVKTPEDDPSIAGSFIIMKRVVLPGSQVDIYFSNHKTTTVYNKTGYFRNNRYGLFYLGNLNFPFSMKYLNFYINGQKLGEDDIDILSDKLIRVHSMPVPMYDLVVESIFTVDDSELAPYIAEYQTDKFEDYLARLFQGANYAGSMDVDSNYNINEVYESFIDTVDSVNKRPNPSSREAEWISSYSDEDQYGPHNDGSVTLGEDILCSIVVGNIYVVAGVKGKIASCLLSDDLCNWTACNAERPSFEGAIFSNGRECNNEDITAVTIYHDYLIFGTKNGHLYAYDTRQEVWYDKSRIPFLNIDNTWPSNTKINGFLVDSVSDVLYMYGDNGSVDAYRWSDESWCGTDYDELKSPLKSVGTTGVMGDIYTAFMINSKPYRSLIVAGENGEVASCYVDCEEINGWCKPDSSLYLAVGAIKPKYYSNGEYRNYSTVRSHCDYFGFKVFVGDNGVVSYFDGAFFINSDPLKICNNGSNFSNHQVNDCISYNEKMMLLGGELGKVSEYEGESQTWFNCDSGLGITSDGRYMEGCDINTMELITGNYNYVIFAGQDGKVSSYAINISQVPYRYEPFKSSFLEWYTTPGNAVIQTDWDIPEEIAKMFDMLLESNTEDAGSICITAGANDLMVDIDMNDNDTYAWTLEERRKFIADFIKEEMPDGIYSIDEIYEAFMKSKYRFMLYEEDLPYLRGGDEISGEDSIDITD